MSNAHAYVGPSISASGISFAEYLTGAEAHLEAFITALSAGTAAPTTAFTWSATGGGSSGGSLAAGTYYGVACQTNGIGSTTPGPVSSQITVAAGDQPEISAFPALQTGNNARDIYLTAPGGASTGPFFLYQMGVTASTLVLTAAAPTDSSGAVQPPATNTTVWGSDKLQLIRYCKTGQFQKVWSWYRQQQSTYASGEPKSFSDCITKLRDAGLVFAILNAMANEAGALMVANPGHIVNAGTGIGGETVRRTFP